jgi:hypothetical protein
LTAKPFFTLRNICIWNCTLTLNSEEKDETPAPATNSLFSALTSSLAFSQNQQPTTCHTPESAGNFVGPDESIVNGMICKTVKTQPTPQQITPQQSTAPSPSGQSQPASGKASEITNARVIEMSKLGLDDDIIIARIKHGTCHFQLGDADLLDSKRRAFRPKS